MTAGPARAERLSGVFALVLQSAKRGGSLGFERLYRAFAGPVAGYLRLQGASDPDDLTNQVFFDAFSAIGEFEGDEAGFRAWLFTIAHRRLVDERRYRSRRPVLDDTGVDGSPAGDPAGGNSEDDAMAVLGTDRVIGLCSQLSADQRDVILMRMVAGTGIAETAAALGKTETAVKALQRRGLGALRRILENDRVSR